MEYRLPVQIRWACRSKGKVRYGQIVSECKKMCAFRRTPSLENKSMGQFNLRSQADGGGDLQHAHSTAETCSIYLFMHRNASQTTRTRGFMANLCITLGTLWVPVSGKCVQSNREELFWLQVKIINRQIHLYRSFQRFNLGQQLPAIHKTENGLIFISDLFPFHPCCSPPCVCYDLFIMIHPLVFHFNSSFDWFF